MLNNCFDYYQTSEVIQVEYDIWLKLQYVHNEMKWELQF